MVFGEPGSSATVMTWLNVPLFSVMSMPTFFASDAQVGHLLAEDGRFGA